MARSAKRWVNVLMLAVVADGVAVPLVWLVFEKKGCSDAEERKQILERYLKIFPVETIRFVTADREFACHEWLQFLNRQQIGFCLRVKASAQITDKRGKRMRASKLLQTAKIGTAVVCRRRRKMCGVLVSVAGMRKVCGDNVIVISSFDSAEQLLPSYCLRWQIETLFGCLKTRGFRLEDTHLLDAERVSRLLTLLTLAFCWAMMSGELVCQKQPPKKKKHGRPERSVFRVGLDYLRRRLCRPESKGQKQEKKRLILLLSFCEAATKVKLFSVLFRFLIQRIFREIPTSFCSRSLFGAFAPAHLGFRLAAALTVLRFWSNQGQKRARRGFFESCAKLNF